MNEKVPVFRQLEDDKFLEKALPIVIAVFFISEALTKIGRWSDLSFYNVSAIVKLTFIVGAFFLLIKQRRLKLFVFIFSMTCIFIIGQISFNDWKFNLDTLLENSVYLGRFLFIFILASVFQPYEKEFIPRAFKVFELIILVNSLLIIIGSIFDLSLFKTYSTRFGYNGFFMTPTMISFFNALSMTYLWRKIELEKKGAFLFILVLVASFLTGTKAILLFIVFMCFHLTLRTKIYRNKKALTGILLLFVLLIIFKNKILGTLKTQYSVLYDVYINDGLFSMLTSYRNENLIDIYQEIFLTKWTVFNYLFGGTDFDKYRIEFDILDVFLFFGLIGGAIYLWNYFSRIVKFKLFDNYSTIQIIILLGIGILAGTFFNGAPLALYFILTINYLTFSKKWK